MATRMLLTIAVLLICAVPADASTLDFRDEAYAFEGTGADEHLAVVLAGGAVSFTDRDGQLTGSPGLPADCAPASTHTISCLTLPTRRTLVDGTAGDDVLIGSGGEEAMIGGEGDDVLGPGLGADAVDGGFGEDTLDLSQDGRGEGVSVSLKKGPDAGDTSTAIEALVLTGSDDFADVSGNASARVECGGGDDLYKARLIGFQGPTSTTEADELVDCEAAGSGPGAPVSGNVDLFARAEKLFKLRKRRIVAKGNSVCSFAGRACRLRVVARVERGNRDQLLERPYRLGSSTFRVPAGAPHQVAVKLTKAGYARFQRLPGRYLTFQVKLTKPGSWVTGDRYGAVKRRYEGQPARH